MPQAFFVAKFCCMKMLTSVGEKRKLEVCAKQHAFCRPTTLLISTRSPPRLSKRKLGGKKDGIEGPFINDLTFMGEGVGPLFFTTFSGYLETFFTKN